jgi:hypothetical protein
MAPVMRLSNMVALLGAVSSGLAGCTSEDKAPCADGFGRTASGVCEILDGSDDTPSVPSPTEERPTIESVEIGPESVQTNGSIWSKVILDGERVDTGIRFEDYPVKYVWYVDGEESIGTAAHLHGWSYFDKDQLISLVVSHLDGDGPSKPSNPITVLNTPPEAPDVWIEPADPLAYNDDLVCKVGASVDEDLDELTYEIVWAVDGDVWIPEGPPSKHDPTDYDTSTPPETGDSPAPGVVPAQYTSLGQVWTCRVRAFDGQEFGQTTSVTVTIDNER